MPGICSDPYCLVTADLGRNRDSRVYTTITISPCATALTAMHAVDYGSGQATWPLQVESFDLSDANTTTQAL
jgi:hypothetical protein